MLPFLFKKTQNHESLERGGVVPIRFVISHKNELIITGDAMTVPTQNTFTLILV